jgi:hypothetical protein
MTAAADRRDWVGPVLQAGATANAVVAAIRQENPAAEIIDRGSYLRVLAPHCCSVSRSEIETHLGGVFILPGDLEKIMPSFKGSFRVSEDGASWSFAERK